MPSLTFDMTNIPVCIPLDLWYHPSHSHHQDFPRLFLTFPGYPGSKKWKKNLKLPWAPNPLKWHHPKQKKKAQNSQLTAEVGLHHWISRLRMAIFLSFLGLLGGQFDRETPEWISTWKPPSLFKVLKDIERSKVFEKQRLSTIPRVNFWSPLLFLVNFGILGISKVAKNPKAFKHFPLFGIWTKITTWILRS